MIFLFCFVFPLMLFSFLSRVSRFWDWGEAPPRAAIFSSELNLHVLYK